jgi:hypothetical protein
MKSILVIDTPKNCSECKLAKLGFQCSVIKGFHSIKYQIINKEIHPQCPLQDATELLEALEKLKPSGWRLDEQSQTEYIKENSYNKLRNALGGNDEL